MKRSIFIFNMIFMLIAVITSQDKPDALRQYRNGRDLEFAGRNEDAQAAYVQAVEICKQELAINPKNMDAYTIIGWSLVRLGKYQESVNLCLEGLKINQDYRIIETLAESYFYLGSYKESLKNMEKYIDAAPKGDRISTAYFFVGEIYRLAKAFNKADIAYTAAVYLEPGIALWWYRLGGVREVAGNKSGAAEAYLRALKLRPDYKEAMEGANRVRT